MRRGRIHGEKNMRNSRTKTQTKLRNYIKLTAGALLLAITFVLVFAGTLSGAFGIESDLQQNGIIENNVASAEENVYKEPIQVDFSNDPTTTSIDVGTSYPDYYDKRSKFCDTSANHTSNCTWNATTWGIGNNSYHTATRYAHVAFDFDLGADWKKYSDSISFSLKGTVSPRLQRPLPELFHLCRTGTGCILSEACLRLRSPHVPRLRKWWTPSDASVCGYVP